MRICLCLILIVCLSTSILSEEWQKSTSSFGYTVQYPSTWTIGNVYQNSDVWMETICEHSTMFHNSGAQISIDAWKTYANISLEQWFDIMQDLLKLEGMDYKKITATEQNVEAIQYFFSCKKQQAYNSQMTYFKYQDKVFRISYLEKDLGTAQEIYNHVLKTFSFEHSMNAMPALNTTVKPATRVYTCGNQNDDCQCGMDNPYPCCDNGGNCTWWAWEKACCHWGVGLPSPWRHAKYWATDLSSHGYKVSSTPKANTVACRDVGTYGHVAWVLEVSGSKVKVSEMNCCGGCNYGVREYWYDASYFSGGYISR